MSDHSSDRTDSGPGNKFTGMDASSRATAPELAPEQELSAPPPDDIVAPRAEASEPEAPRVEASVTEPRREADVTEAPLIEPKIDADAPKMDASVIEPKIEAGTAKAETPPSAIEPAASKADAPIIEPGLGRDAPKADAVRETGRMMMVPPSRSTSWDRPAIDRGAAGDGDAQRSGKRRLAAIAAVAVLAAITGAIGGSLATSGLRHDVASEQSSATAGQTEALEATIKQLQSEVATLKGGIDRAAKGDAGQFARINDRLDKVEKAHAESAAKLTRLHETLDKQHAAVAPAASPAAASSTSAATIVTGSIPTTAASTAATAPVPLPAPKPAVARLPAVEGWVLRDITDGGALIEGRGGLYEVYAGDPVPGLGRVNAIRKQDGRWVVVTSRGLIVAR
ncbi:MULTISPECIES: hypothetical protein [unclassified Nitrobacter]|uniref:hypothetical protein n=1 Tax=unclassified Nitrobacter TaxID=2620411 RepID=UPI000927AA1D|nr:MULTISPECIES: hypothetical protein [unclassified Nitrobacter]OJV02642.1 MAG: hypothetical protein BGO16_06825 [Nitrobacter sp. 62-23]